MESARKAITRFAPSPTGFLHVGGLRTALYSYLLAKQTGGKFLLRIEDTDRERFVTGGIENILASLYWTGIVPNEGVTLAEDATVIEKGDAGPYIQSKKLDEYRKYAEQLVALQKAYYCFCTPERLEEVRNYRQANKLPPGYDGHCRSLPVAEVTGRLAREERHVIRLSMPDEGETTFYDLIRGEVTFKNADVDDQVLLKSDGYPTYHLAVVVDDHTMGVTHVIRGEEWISSTPKHITLYRYFGWEIPLFAHLPLLLNSDKSKLSKRQGDVAVLDYRDKGYLPEALVNFVAFLGWNPGTEQEFFSLEELVTSFSLAKVNKAGAVFNLEKLDWFNREYLKQKPTEELAHYFDMFMPEDIKNLPSYTKEYVARLAPLLVERVSKGIDLTDMYVSGELIYFFVNPTYDTNNLFWKTIKDRTDRKEKTREYLLHLLSLLEAISTTEFTDVHIKKVVWPFAESLANKGEVLWPMRYALSGRDKSPDPFVLASVLGKEETKKRLQKAIALLV
ncbi:MAG: glutamate--tRNA ligase [Candidatus Pacebacteria bacterium]|jgi:glutamyl-tRNA synthetase|nr:glutamate--tRNA ligase [Candidatus Paceibacterota bacterium]